MYVCRPASLQDLREKWDHEIACNGPDRENWLRWKEQSLENFSLGYIVTYVGILDDKIISEATAGLDPRAVQNSDGLLSADTAYLSAFRTLPGYQGKGYFSRLLHFMIADLWKRGYKSVTLGVEPTDAVNRARYDHYGFNEYIKSAKEFYPDGTVIDVDYYKMSLDGYQGL